MRVLMRPTDGLFALSMLLLGVLLGGPPTSASASQGTLECAVTTPNGSTRETFRRSTLPREDTFMAQAQTCAVCGRLIQPNESRFGDVRNGVAVHVHKDCKKS